MIKKIKYTTSALLILSLFSSYISISHANDITLSFIGDTKSSAYLGVKQGVDEANIQGQFLGQHYVLTTESLTSKSPLSIAIFADVNATQLRQLVKKHPHKAIFNLTNKDNQLRSDCYDNLFHTIASQAMLNDATKQWQQKNAKSNTHAMVWHASFKKYAAGQLNARYLASHQIKMDDNAWAGWAASKLLSDAIARTQPTNPTSLLDFLKTELAFDGQKGISLSFRETGQLRQPLLLISNDKIVGEAPVRGIVKTTNLDSLGLAQCPK